jgi:hypothetical protein
VARGREAKCTDPGIAELLQALARVPVTPARDHASCRTCGGFAPCQSHHMDRMDHGPLRKKSGSARGGLTEGFCEGTERVHGPQQDRFARSRKALRRGAGGTGRRVLPWRGRSSRHPSASWDLAQSRETMAIPAFAGMTNTSQFASAQRILRSSRMIRPATSIYSRSYALSLTPSGPSVRCS